MKMMTHSVEETEKLAASIGARLRGGETIELISDLGGGKTTFVRGLTSGAGSQDRVASPTFTVSKVYKTPKFEILHFDFYRLPEAGVMEHELHEVKDDEKVVLVVEWGEVVKHVLPDKKLRIKLTATGDNERQIEIEAPNELKYLLEHK